MDGRDAHIEMTRTLRLDAATFAAALVGLRREMTGLSQRWSLADRGSFELDARISAPALTRPEPVELDGRLWNPEGSAVAPISITATSDDVVTMMVLVPTGTIPQWFRDRLAQYLDLAHAALDELCEELLFHAASHRRSVEHA